MLERPTGRFVVVLLFAARLAHVHREAKSELTGAILV